MGSTAGASGVTLVKAMVLGVQSNGVGEDDHMARARDLTSPYRASLDRRV